MPVELYETLFILDSTKLSSEPDAVKSQLHTTLERYGAEIIVSRPWDDRKLMYPIKKQKKGAYHAIYYNVESTKQRDIERDFAINESVLRLMTSHIDPKWAEAIMDVAKNDTGLAFAIRGMQEEASSDGLMPNLDGGMEGEAFTAAGGGRGRGRREYGDKD